MTDLPTELDKAVKDINAVPRPNDPPELRFMEFATNLSKAIVESAAFQLKKAEANLKIATEHADSIAYKAKEMQEILLAFERDLDEYRESALETHRKFNHK